GASRRTAHPAVRGGAPGVRVGRARGSGGLPLRARRRAAPPLRRGGGRRRDRRCRTRRPPAPRGCPMTASIHVLPSARVVPLGPFPLHHGGVLQHAQVGYSCTGPENAPAVVVLGGISAGRDLAW